MCMLLQEHNPLFYVPHKIKHKNQKPNNKKTNKDEACHANIKTRNCIFLCIQDPLWGKPQNVIKFATEICINGKYTSIRNILRITAHKFIFVGYCVFIVHYLWCKGRKYRKIWARIPNEFHMNEWKLWLLDVKDILKTLNVCRQFSENPVKLKTDLSTQTPIQTKSWRVKAGYGLRKLNREIVERFYSIGL